MTVAAVLICAVSVSSSYPPSSPIPLPPPSPPFLPTPSLYSHEVGISFRAAGTISDFSQSRVESIRALFVSKAGVSSFAVSASVVSGSVIVTVVILTASAAEATALRAQLASELASMEAANNFFSSLPGDGVTVVSTPVVYVGLEAGTQSSSEDGLSGGAVCGIIVGVLIVVAAICVGWRSGSISTDDKQKHTRAAISHPHTASHSKVFV